MTTNIKTELSKIGWYQIIGGAGFYLSVGLDFSNSLDIKFDIGISKFDFNVNREHERTEISFNLVAFGLICWINKLMKKVKIEKDNTEIASIGK